jgi:retinoid hydroxylase
VSIVSTAVKPFEAIPVVTLPEGYERELPSWVARQATEHGPIFRVVYPWSGFSPVYLVGPEANRFVLHTGREHFSHEAGWTPIIGAMLGKGILNMDGAEHARDRKMMNPGFTIAYMSRYLPIMARVIRERTADWAARGEVDLFEETRRITFDVAAEALIGFRTGAEVDRMRELFMTLLYQDFDPETMTREEIGARLAAAQRELFGTLLLRIAERRERPTDDILGLMVSARDDEGRALSDEQILGHVNILLVAGHETSTTMSSWLLYLLATHPEYLARVRAEVEELAGPDPDGPIGLEAIKAMRVLGNALMEAGRLWSPVASGPRGVVKPFEFAGYHVPAGTQARYSIAGGHWLPAIFADPGRFDPDRFAAPREEDKKTPYALVPFGGGPRICIGVNFAQVEIKALAAHVLRAYDLEPVPGQDIVQLYAPTIGSPSKGIRMRVHARVPALA